jgi:hypothetical protein
MMITQMKARITRKVIAVAVLLAAAVTFLFTGMAVENTVRGTWVSPCEVEYSLRPSDIIQVGDTLYLSSDRLYVSSEKDSTICLFKSSDGCKWSEIELTIFGEGESIWRHGGRLFTAPGDNLGLVWIETPSKKEKGSQSTILLSRYDGSTWSEPEILCQRAHIYYLDDVMVLENGALLLLWNERLVHTIKDGDRTFEYSGCVVVYRAYISNEELLIDRVIEPEDTMSCKASGYFFVDDGQHIWCVFEYGLDRKTATIYRSVSINGKEWSPPEPVDLPDSVCSEAFVTPQGEIGILDFDVGNKNLFLLTSPDWKKWSREKLFRAENGIRGALITEKSDMMWGFVYTDGAEDELLFTHSEEGSTDYKGRMTLVKICEGLSGACIVLLVVLLATWLWNLKRNQSSDS